MTVSILTPSYNYARFMTANLASVSSQQTSDAVEHLVSDGGSLDGTVDLLEAFRSRHELRWWSGPDKGQSDALNRAFASSTGDVIGWLNSDDFYLPGAIDAVCRYFADHPEVGVVYGDVVMTNGEGHVDRLLALYDDPRLPLKWRGCILQSTATFFRRDVLSARPWDVSLRTVMDWDLFLQLQEEGVRFAHLRRPLAGFRLHSDQVTHGLSSRTTDEHLVVRARHRAAPRTARLARPAGDVLHGLKKWSAGSYDLQKQVLGLRGLPLMSPDGVVDLDTWGQVLGLYAGKATRSRAD